MEKILISLQLEEEPSEIPYTEMGNDDNVGGSGKNLQTLQKEVLLSVILQDGTLF